MAAGEGGADTDLVIVGAGAAGLAAAHRFRELRPDLGLRVLEAADQIGGRARTVIADGVPIDLGCGWLHGGPDNVWAGIAKTLGFAIDRNRAPWDGAERDLDLNQTETRMARQAMHAFFERAETRAEQEPDVALSALLEPDGRWNGYIGAVATFINGTELEHASTRDYGRYEPGVGPDYRVPDGYGHLIATFGEDLPVSLGTPVRAIDHGGHRLRVETDRGTIEARAVLVTISTTQLANEAIRFTPALPDKIAAAKRLPLGVANKLYLRWPSSEPLKTEHYRIGATDRVATAAYHIGPFGRPVIECYFGGALARDLEQAGMAATVAFARDELAELLGSDVAAKLEPLVRTAWAGMPFIGGSYSYAEPGAVPQRATLARPVDERLFFAGEACSPHRFSTAHGAYETGVAAVERIVAAL